MRRIAPILAALAAALALSPAAPAHGQQPAAAAPEPVAVLVRLSGAVQVQRPAAAPVAGTVGMRLAAGDQVLVPAQAQAVLLLRTGRTQTLTRTTRVSAPRGPQRTGVFRQTVRTLSQVASTDARTQPNRQGMIRPLAGAAVPIAPRNEVRVRAARPAFVWHSVPGAAGYHVQLRRVDGPVARASAGADTTWTPGEGFPALEPGASYEWSVAAGEDGRAAPPQRFRVATAAEEAGVEARLAEIRALGLNPSGDGLFLAAVVFHEAGMLYDARDALDALAASGLPLGRDFHLLRGQVYDALGVLDAAASAFAAADAAEG